MNRFIKKIALAVLPLAIVGFAGVASAENGSGPNVVVERTCSLHACTEVVKLCDSDGGNCIVMSSMSWKRADPRD